jgi:AraC family transcriptional regulator, arabinose operon regulatory protein
MRLPGNSASDTAKLLALFESDAFSPRIKFKTQFQAYSSISATWIAGPRVLPDQMIYFITDGAITGIVEDRPVKLNAGDLIWVPPGAKHEFSAAAKVTFLYHIRFSFVTNTMERKLRKVITIRRMAWHLRKDFERIADEIYKPRPCRNICLEALAAIVCIGILRADGQGEEELPGLSANQQAHLVKFVHKNIMRRVSPSEIAEELRLSSHYFSRLFGRTFQMPPRVWLMRERIRLAAISLCQTQLSIKEVAFRYGYHDVYLFSRQFKELFGHSPRQYRKYASSDPLPLDTKRWDIIRQREALSVPHANK